MGQGLYTKIIQIVASEFEIPLRKVYIAETSFFSPTKWPAFPQ